MWTVIIGAMILWLPATAGAVVLSSGDIIVTDSSRIVVARIDPVSGAETIITGGGVGSGTPFDNVSAGVGVSPDLSTVYVVDDSLANLFSIDVATGARTVLRTAGPDETFTGIAVAPAGPLPSVSSLPTWGIAVLVGILLGLGVKGTRRSLAPA
jgi:hypothetical protein